MPAAVKDKKAGNEKLAQFLPIIAREVVDGRIMVKKGVNRALRQIGKRNLPLNKAAIDYATRILAQGNKSGNWIARDALPELKSEAIQAGLARQAIPPTGVKQ